MDSSVSGLAQIVPKECDNNIHFPANKKNTNTSRRTPSFSSSSSSSCSSSLGSLYFPDDSPLNPATPLRFSGVPFSWEHLPGIPKKNTIFKRKESILKPQQQQQLPLPPTSTPPSSKKNHFQDFFATRGKKHSTENFKRDPFIAALVECSKDDDDDDDDYPDQDRSSRNFFNGGKVTRSISDRFGFVHLYTSCKKTCAVSESIVYLPRSSRTTSYDLIHRRSR